MTEARRLRARYRKIMRFAVRYIVQEWWFEIALPRVGLSVVGRRNRSARTGKIARHFHLIAIDLGGLMIKVGQFMSSRLDVLPPEITTELEGLQDEVPAVDFALIRQFAEVDLGVPLERVFATFDPIPLAAASLGQVHKATLLPADAVEVGFSDVVVKVQRPGVDQLIVVDLSALRKIARWLNRVGFISRRVNLPALLEEFATISLLEIDYLHEAQNAVRFAENFDCDSRVRAPEVVWERTTRRILTLSDVGAIKINNREELVAAGINPVDVAVELSRAMFEQLFTHGFFHADPHPGNIFVTPNPSRGIGGAAPSWALTFVDFGMMGEVPDSLRYGLQRLIVAVAARDAKGLVSSFKGMGVLLPVAESAPLEHAMSALFDRFGGMGFAELQKVDPAEFRDFAKEFGDVMRSLPFQLPENFLLIIRAVSVTSGVCSALNPDFNVWTAIEPYAKTLAKSDVAQTVKVFARQLFETAGLLARLPQQIDELNRLVNQGNLSVKTPGVDSRLRGLERLVQRAVSAMIFAGLLLGGIFLKPTDPTLGWLLMGGSILPLMHAVFAGFSGRDRAH